MNPSDRAQRLSTVVVAPDVTVEMALSRLDRAGTGILLVCDAGGRMIGTLTDGDIRRAILRGVTLSEPCGNLANLTPLLATDGITSREALSLMDTGRSFLVNHLPVVDADGRAVDLLLRRDLEKASRTGAAAVVMAGGFGSRLRPLTDALPKPMLPMGGRPLLERIIEQIRDAGIRRVSITTHFQPEKITSHFQDGRAFGVELGYVNEDIPLGTAGALALLPPPSDPLLVVNGDILTSVNFSAMLDFHREHHADLTVGVRRYDVEVPYGVVEGDGPNVTRLSEKPTFRFLVNAGIYVLEPSLHARIPRGRRFDMTDLISLLLAEGGKVVNFPIVEYWLDVGQRDDYLRAEEDLRSGKLDRSDEGPDE